MEKKFSIKDTTRVEDKDKNEKYVLLEFDNLNDEDKNKLLNYKKILLRSVITDIRKN